MGHRHPIGNAAVVAVLQTISFELHFLPKELDLLDQLFRSILGQQGDLGGRIGQTAAHPNTESLQDSLNKDLGGRHQGWEAGAGAGAGRGDTGGGSWGTGGARPSIASRLADFGSLCDVGSASPRASLTC